MALTMEAAMPVYVGVHQAPEGADPSAAVPAIRGSWEAYRKAAIDMGLKPLGAVASLERGIGYCQTEAGSIDEVRKAHEVAKVPLKDVYEVMALS
jgi:hypothetical protein